MTIKNFRSYNPGAITTSLQEVHGGQELTVTPGYELVELMAWWNEWKHVMKNPHPSVQDAIQQVKVVHELSKQQTDAKTYSWTETTL